MSYLDTGNDPELTQQEKDVVSALPVKTIEQIDKAILSIVDDRYRKVAYVVGCFLFSDTEQFLNIPAGYYVQRVLHLVSVGELESRGNLKNMRYSEVRRKISTKTLKKHHDM